MVDPIYGEGLFFAYKSGIMVSECILNHINGLDRACLQYEKLRRRDVLKIRQGNILKNVFFTKIIQFLFLNKLKGHENFLRYYIDSQVSYYKYSYKNLWKLVFDYKKTKEW
jgi:flavin-dependent dehydrogenase